MAKPNPCGTCGAKTVNTKYPREQWIQVFTDGSYTADRVTTGAGVFSDLSFYAPGVFSDLSFYAPVGHIWLELGGEVEAILLALSQTKCLCDKVTHDGIKKD